MSLSTQGWVTVRNSQEPQLYVSDVNLLKTHKQEENMSGSIISSWHKDEVHGCHAV